MMAEDEPHRLGEGLPHRRTRARREPAERAEAAG